MEQKKLGSLFLLIMLIVSAIDSIRNLPSTALFGNEIIFFCILGAATFLIPIAWLSSHLTRSYPDVGGIYEWLKMAFSPPLATLGIWLQWINTIIWYPTILSFIAGTLAYTINPALIHQQSFFIGVMVGSFWLLTFMNLYGIQSSALFASICGAIGVFFPLAIIIACAIFWVITNHHIQIHLNPTHWIPQHLEDTHWTSLTAIIASYLGIELATVHSHKIKNANRLFPPALLISTLIIISTMILGSFSIAIVIPAKDLNLVQGVMQAFNYFFNQFHLSFLSPTLAACLIIGSLGGMINWIISPSEGLVQASMDKRLPEFISKKNRHGAAHWMLIIQAMIVTLLGFSFVFIKSINQFYWLLTDLSTELYLIMYVLFIGSAVVLLRKKESSISVIIIASLGFIGCLIALVVGFFPPKLLYGIKSNHYSLIFSTALITMMAPGLIIAYLSNNKK